MTFDRHVTAKLNTNGLSTKNPYLNSFVCLLVFTVVSGAIESDFVEF